MNWGEFKKTVEAFGARDDDDIRRVIDIRKGETKDTVIVCLEIRGKLPEKEGPK